MERFLTGRSLAHVLLVALLVCPTIHAIVYGVASQSDLEACMLDTSSSGCFITNNTMVTMNTALTAIDRYTPLFLYGVDFTSVLELNGTIFVDPTYDIVVHDLTISGGVSTSQCGGFLCANNGSIFLNFTNVRFENFGSENGLGAALQVGNASGLLKDVVFDTYTAASGGVVSLNSAHWTFDSVTFMNGNTTNTLSGAQSNLFPSALLVNADSGPSVLTLANEIQFINHNSKWATQIVLFAVSASHDITVLPDMAKPPFLNVTNYRGAALQVSLIGTGKFDMQLDNVYAQASTFMLYPGDAAGSNGDPWCGISTAPTSYQAWVCPVLFAVVSDLTTSTIQGAASITASNVTASATALLDAFQVQNATFSFENVVSSYAYNVYNIEVWNTAHFDLTAVSLSTYGDVYSTILVTSSMMSNETITSAVMRFTESLTIASNGGQATNQDWMSSPITVTSAQLELTAGSLLMQNAGIHDQGWHGGAIQVSNGANVTITTTTGQIHFYHNFPGGLGGAVFVGRVLYCVYCNTQYDGFLSSLTLTSATDILFQNNFVQPHGLTNSVDYWSAGGAVAVCSQGFLKLVATNDVLFDNNIAGNGYTTPGEYAIFGGAVYVGKCYEGAYPGTMQINAGGNVDFNGNYVETGYGPTGGALYMEDNAIMYINSGSNSSVTFENNFVQVDGCAGVDIGDGVLACPGGGAISLQSGSFLNIQTQYLNITLNSITATGVTNNSFGGALFVNASSFVAQTQVGTSFSGNGFYDLNTNSTGGALAALLWSSVDFEASNAGAVPVTFVQNTADYGAAIFIDQSLYSTFQNATFVNNTATTAGCWIDVLPSSQCPTILWPSSQFNGNTYINRSAATNVSTCLAFNDPCFGNYLAPTAPMTMPPVVPAPVPVGPPPQVPKPPPAAPVAPVTVPVAAPSGALNPCNSTQTPPPNSTCVNGIWVYNSTFIGGTVQMTGDANFTGPANMSMGAQMNISGNMVLNGSLTMQAGSSMVVGASASINGSVSMQNASMTITSGATITGGLNATSGGQVYLGGVVQISSGVNLDGSSMTSLGTLSIGGSATVSNSSISLGTTTILGSFSAQSESTLQLSAADMLNVGLDMTWPTPSRLDISMSASSSSKRSTMISATTLMNVTLSATTPDVITATFSSSDIASLQASGGTTTLDVLEAASIGATTVTAVTPSTSCETINTQSSVSTGTRETLTAVFTLDTSACGGTSSNTWKIIVGVVLGVVGLIVVGMVLLVIFVAPARKFFLPFLDTHGSNRASVTRIATSQRHFHNAPEAEPLNDDTDSGEESSEDEESEEEESGEEEESSEKEESSEEESSEEESSQEESSEEESSEEESSEEESSD